ncbi:GLPGLI family protein [Flavobacterium sp. K5-23]|uniref:GLPGLI family protein n=1 Tax=Flavobacterium sp. K5-23 TaxID=2746225 RepID=UPI00200CAA88|nr:GLPGLI family protein [Flavobacterium sp. K5-23]UQD55233.1 GLPGLI family protein [Flavobacterium sp. K5-23]
MKQYVLVILTLFSISVFAQKSIKITYEQKIVYSDSFFNQLPEEDREGFRTVLSKPNKFELINNGDFSLFKSVNLKEEVIVSKEKNTPTYTNAGTFFKPFKVWVLKDFTKQLSVESAEVDDNEYYIEVPFAKDELHYDKKTKAIDGYTCKSAYAMTAANDTIQYWYTQEIPVIDGPFSMNSIPGLVLSVESKKKVIYVTKIEFFDKKIQLESVPAKASFITKEKLNKMKIEALKPKSYTDESGAKHETYSVHIKADN